MAKYAKKKATGAAEQEENAPEAQPTETPDVGSGASTKDASHLDVQDILDEIDELLEENAEEFVKSYIQKGGQ